MQTYSSTTLKTFSRNCPAAMAKQLNNEPADRTIYAAGVTAHAIAEEVGQFQNKIGNHVTEEELDAIIDRTCETLLSEGREYNKQHEPPLPPESVFEGRDVARTYFTFNPFAPEQALYEVGYGMTAAGEPCDYYDDKCRFRAVIDVVYFELYGDEECALNASIVRDYKTAWSADESELDTLQRKGQAVLTWMHNPDADIIVCEVVNMRTGQPFKKELQLDDGNIALLELWKKDLLMLCDAADKTSEARAGAGCIGCSYVMSCDDCMSYAKVNKEDHATAYATLEAQRAEYIKILKPLCALSNVPVTGGFIGYMPANKKVVNKSAARVIVNNWYMSDGEPHDQEAGLLAALNMGSTNIEKVAKAMYPERGDIAKEDILQQCITVNKTTRFGAHKG